MLNLCASMCLHALSLLHYECNGKVIVQNYLAICCWVCAQFMCKYMYVIAFSIICYLMSALASLGYYSSCIPNITCICSLYSCWLIITQYEFVLTITLCINVILCTHLYLCTITAVFDLCLHLYSLELYSSSSEMPPKRKQTQPPGSSPSKKQERGLLLQPSHLHILLPRLLHNKE